MTPARVTAAALARQALAMIDGAAALVRNDREISLHNDRALESLQWAGRDLEKAIEALEK